MVTFSRTGAGAGCSTLVVECEHTSARARGTSSGCDIGGGGAGDGGEAAGTTGTDRSGGDWGRAGWRGGLWGGCDAVLEGVPLIAEADRLPGGVSVAAGKPPVPGSAGSHLENSRSIESAMSVSHETEQKE